MGNMVEISPERLALTVKQSGLCNSAFGAQVGHANASWVSSCKTRGTMDMADVLDIKEKFGVDITPKAAKRGERITPENADRVKSVPLRPSEVAIDPAKLIEAQQNSMLNVKEFALSLGNLGNGWFSQARDLGRMARKDALLIKALYGVDITKSDDKPLSQGSESAGMSEEISKKLDDVNKKLETFDFLYLNTNTKIDELMKEVKKLGEDLRKRQENATPGGFQKRKLYSEQDSGVDGK